MVKITKKIKKISLLILILLVLMLFIPKSYEINYNKDNIDIKEIYDNENKLYTLYLTYDNKVFPFKMLGKGKKKIIDKVNIYNENNIQCLIPEGKKLNFNPICYKDDSLVSYNLIDKFKKDNINYQNDTFNKLNISYLNDKHYLIWNYKGFYSLGSKNQEIKLFNDDIYTINIATKVNDKLLIANYENKYTIDKFYLINKKDKVKEIKVKNDISFDSYILGTYKDNVYLFDRKNKREYQINIKKLKIDDITKKNTGKVLNKNNFEKISVNKLASSDYKFTNIKPFDYEIIDNKLYETIGDYHILISEKETKYIVNIDKDSVYYLVGDTLYLYEKNNGEVKLISNFEWNFNYENMIFVF